MDLYGFIWFYMVIYIYILYIYLVFDMGFYVVLKSFCMDNHGIIIRHWDMNGYSWILPCSMDYKLIFPVAPFSVIKHGGQLEITKEKGGLQLGKL